MSKSTSSPLTTPPSDLSQWSVAVDLAAAGQAGPNVVLKMPEADLPENSQQDDDDDSSGWEDDGSSSSDGHDSLNSEDDDSPSPEEDESSSSGDEGEAGEEARSQDNGAAVSGISSVSSTSTLSSFGSSAMLADDVRHSAYVRGRTIYGSGRGAESMAPTWGISKLDLNSSTPKQYRTPSPDSESSLYNSSYRNDTPTPSPRPVRGIAKQTTLLNEPPVKVSGGWDMASDSTMSSPRKDNDTKRDTTTTTTILNENFKVGSEISPGISDMSIIRTPNSSPMQSDVAKESTSIPREHRAGSFIRSISSPPALGKPKTKRRDAMGRRPAPKPVPAYKPIGLGRKDTPPGRKGGYSLEGYDTDSSV